MPYKSKDDRLRYHRRYYQSHREEFRAYADAGRDINNARRRERRRSRRAGEPDNRRTHGKSDSIEYRLLLGAKKRARSKGTPCSLTVHDIPAIPSHCPVLGIEIKPAAGRMQDHSPSLDRLNAASGYVRGNVRVISWRANRLRSDGTAAELLLVARDAAAIEGEFCANTR